MSTSFDSFNARNLRAKDVAETFIDSDDFNLVLKNCHSIILGPRGSGKTTLLKMITIPAIATWNEGHENKFSPPFTSIYIPTDIVWHHQLLLPDNIVSKAPAFFARASKAAVCTAVMLAVIEAFMDRLQYQFGPRKAEETNLSETLIEGWKLEPTIPKLSQVYLTLRKRVLILGTLFNKSIHLLDTQNLESKLPAWADDDFFANTEYAIEAFDVVFSQDRESRWALCFDELELAPEWLQKSLFNFPRSRNQKILFKLSSSPDPEIFAAGHVTPSDDVELIPLWRSTMVARRAFCRELALSVMRRNDVLDFTPEEFLGVSNDDQASDEDASSPRPYTENSPEYELIKEVASWDASLARLLESNEIDPRNPVASDVTQKDTILRKIKPVVALRREFVKARNDGTLIRRSRKTSSLYARAPAVYDLSDGNPRRLIRMMEELCVHALKDGDGTVKPVSSEVQARVMTASSYLFRDYLKMLPGSLVTLEDGRQTVQLYDLLREIGRYFSSGLLVGPFPLDPKSSFTVDPDTDEGIIKLLRLASYHGAILKVSGSDAEMADLKGRRFRLCFALCPLFQLPLRLYAPVALSTCASNRRRYTRDSSMNVSKQLTLAITQ